MLKNSYNKKHLFIDRLRLNMVLITTHHQAEANVLQELDTFNVPSDVVTHKWISFLNEKFAGDNPEPRDAGSQPQFEVLRGQSM